jgi:hypothetical protein
MTQPASIANRHAKVTALIFATAALLWTTMNYPALRLAWESRSWPMVPGTLVVDYKKSRFTRMGKLLAYHYRVGTRDFTGSSFDSFGGCRDSDFDSLVMTLLGKTGVEVYYSPKNPTTAFIVPGFRIRHILAIGSCVLLWGIAIQFGREALKQSRARAPARP